MSCIRWQYVDYKLVKNGYFSTAGRADNKLPEVNSLIHIII